MTKSDQKFVLSIDGGGTKTRIIVSDSSGIEMDRGEGGSSNIITMGIDGMLKSVNEAYSNLENDYSFIAMWAGFAGLGPSSFNATKQALSDLFNIPDFDNIILTTDAQLLSSQLTFSPVSTAVGLIAGTGSISMAFSDTNTLCRAGGFGNLLGDEGSGYWIGLEAIKTVLKTNQNNLIKKSPATELPDWQLQVLKLFDTFSVNHSLHYDILNNLHDSTTSKTKIASISKIVFKGAYHDHDPIAQTITKTAASYLAKLVTPLCGLNGGPIDPEDSALILSGSLLLVDEFKNQVLDELSLLNNSPFAYNYVIDDAALVASAATAKKYLS